MKSEESLYCEQKIDEDLKYLDQEISKVSTELKKMELRKNVILTRVEEILEREILSVEEIKKLSKIISSYDFPDILLSPIFLKTVSWMEREIKTKASISEELLLLLETVIAKDDFSLFDSLENIDAFGKLHSFLPHGSIHLEAILNYLTSQGYVLGKVKDTLEKQGMKDVSSKIYKFCDLLVENDCPFYVYSPKVYEKDYRQMM